MSLGLAEPGRQKGFHEVPGHRRSHRPAAHAEDVHVIVLDPLSSREVVVNQRGEGLTLNWLDPAARTPGILLAQTDAPTPLPQTATPRSTFPAATAWASGTTKSG